jgi:hypothetical protein
VRNRGYEPTERRRWDVTWVVTKLAAVCSKPFRVNPRIFARASALKVGTSAARSEPPAEWSDTLFAVAVPQPRIVRVIEMRRDGVVEAGCAGG